MDLSNHDGGLPTPVELATLRHIIQLSANRGYCWATFAAFESMPELGPTSRARPRTPKRDREARREKFRSAIAGLRKKGLLETVYLSPDRDHLVDPASGEGSNTRYCWPTPAGLAICGDFVLRLRTARVNQGKTWPQQFGFDLSALHAVPGPGETNPWPQAFGQSPPGSQPPGGQALEHLARTHYERVQSSGTHVPTAARKNDESVEPGQEAAVRIPEEWSQALERLRPEMPAVFFANFIAPLRFQRTADGVISLWAPSQQLARRVTERYQAVIERALGERVRLQSPKERGRIPEPDVPTLQRVALCM